VYASVSSIQINYLHWPVVSLVKHIYLNALSKSLLNICVSFFVVISLLVIACGSEAWVMNKCDENMINIFERKILRKIFGAVREVYH
jgi:heme/copper-type cytochrome/quinol oxidase subunit 4